MGVQNHEVVKKDGMSGKGVRSGRQDSEMHCLPSESDHVQNGYCKTDLKHDLKINGVKKNGYCTSDKGNGIVSNGYITSGQHLIVDGSVHLEKSVLEKNGHVTKNGYIKNGHCGVVRRQKDNSARGSVSEENSVTEDDQTTSPQSQISHVPENVHIKVSV